MQNYFFMLLFCALSCNAANFHTEEPESIFETEETITRTGTPGTDGAGEDAPYYDKEGLGGYAFGGSFPKSAQIDWSKYQNQPEAAASSSMQVPLASPTPVYGLPEALKGKPKPHGLMKLLGLRYRKNQPQEKTDQPAGLHSKRSNRQNGH